MAADNKAEDGATLSKLNAEEYNEPLFVWANFDDALLSVKVSDGAHAWQGTLSSQQLRVQAELSKMAFYPFLDETMQALSGKHGGQISFAYSMKSTQAGGVELIWKKLSNGIKFQLGTV